MATMARQPFAPLDGARLQALTSTKNRQNAVHAPASKRKASAWTESEDAENVDPHLSAKRSKGIDGASGSGLLKKPAFTLTKAGCGGFGSLDSLFDAKPSSLSAASSPRAVLKPRAPSTKMLVSAGKAKAHTPVRSPMAASSMPASLSSTPAFASLSGRSPIRASRRGGLLTNKRRASHLARSSPPAPSNFGSAAPFSLDAALKGTLSSFDTHLASTVPSASAPSILDDTGMNASWFFEIHEDTPEQEMTNLLQHSTCVLDISSDEESELKARRERAEGRDKENIPPPNDVSQTSSARTAAAAAAAATSADEMSFEKTRSPLGQLNAADFYAEGCDEASVVLVASEEADDEEQPEQQQPEQQQEQQPEEQQPEQQSLAAAAETEAAEASETVASVDEIMGSREAPAAAAALLEPIDGTGKSFQLWESGSQKDEEL